jgi:hypothetical protein
MPVHRPVDSGAAVKWFGRDVAITSEPNDIPLGRGQGGRSGYESIAAAPTLR